MSSRINPKLLKKLENKEIGEGQRHLLKELLLFEYRTGGNASQYTNVYDNEIMKSMRKHMGDSK